MSPAKEVPLPCHGSGAGIEGESFLGRKLINVPNAYEDDRFDQAGDSFALRGGRDGIDLLQFAKQTLEGFAKDFQSWRL